MKYFITLIVLTTYAFVGVSQNNKMNDSSYVVTNSGEKAHYLKVFAKEKKVLCQGLDGKKVTYKADDVKSVVTHKGDMFVYLYAFKHMKDAPDGKSRLATKYCYADKESKKSKYKVIAKNGDNMIVLKKSTYTTPGTPGGGFSGAPGGVGGPHGGGRGVSYLYYFINGESIYYLGGFSEENEQHEEIYQKLLAAFSDCPEIKKIIEDKSIFFFKVSLSTHNKDYKQMNEAFKYNCFEE